MNTPRTDTFMESGPLQRPTLSELADFARQLETELATMTALTERLAEALRLVQKKAKYVANEDNYLLPQFNSCELGVQIRDVSKEALAAYESHKKETP